MTSVVVSIIREVPGLPYRESFGQWKHHMDHCEECQDAMRILNLIGILRDPQVLCPVGRELDIDLAERITFQHEASGNN